MTGYDNISLGGLSQLVAESGRDDVELFPLESFLGEASSCLSALRMPKIHDLRARIGTSAERSWLPQVP